MPNLTEVNQVVARAELAKFFLIAESAEHAPQMFSRYIDAHWHRLLVSSGYDEFCINTVGHQVGHVEDAGHGVVPWVEVYHERFGTLPAVWFADEDSEVDLHAYARYLATRESATKTESPSLAPPLVVGWDCVPTTNDPDYAMFTVLELIAAE